MANNWAIVIGINQYRFLQPLKYAKQDAKTMYSFLMQEAKFDRIFLFTDDSPAIGSKSTEPFRANLLRVLRQIFATPFMKDGDNFWFFFSGHGISHNGQDYLMPLDGDPEDVENTGIPTSTITNYLRYCGADNAVMILDACRSRGKKSGEGIGKQTEAEVRQTGVISLFSCSPDQYSYELEALRQGVFTYALLEGLGIRGRCATLERLNQYLEHRVPDLVSQYLGRVRQTPYTIAEPLSKSHLILMPQHASLSDIATLKNDAYRAQVKQDWDLAQRLWIRVNAAASGQDMEAIDALQSIGIQRHSKEDLQQPLITSTFFEPVQISADLTTKNLDNVPEKDGEDLDNNDVKIDTDKYLFQEHSSQEIPPRLRNLPELDECQEEEKPVEDLIVKEGDGNTLVPPPDLIDTAPCDLPAASESELSLDKFHENPVDSETFDKSEDSVSLVNKNQSFKFEWGWLLAGLLFSMGSPILTVILFVTGVATLQFLALLVAMSPLIAIWFSKFSLPWKLLLFILSILFVVIPMTIAANYSGS